MKTLIIHPCDPSTGFLKSIYGPISDKTVIDGGILKNELRKIISNYDRIIMLGHGTLMGLLSVNQFGEDAGFEIIDDSMSGLLSEKKDNVYIWCHASEFMRINQLDGFGTSMFISELSEAASYGFDVSQDTIDESNYTFSYIMSKHINHSLMELYKNVLHEYGQLAKINPIAEFNLKRITLFRNEHHSFI